MGILYAMPQSFPILCGSFAGRASQVGVRVHNAAYRALGLNYTYVAFSIRDAHSAVAAMRALSMRGCAITMPFKETVLPLLDRLDPHAAAIGAVNTIVNDDDILTGYNTDWLAARQALEEVTALDGKVAAVLGAGGASRAVCYALSSRGCTVHVFNRTVARAEERRARLWPGRRASVGRSAAAGRLRSPREHDVGRIPLRIRFADPAQTGFHAGRS